MRDQKDFCLNIQNAVNKHDLEISLNNMKADNFKIYSVKLEELSYS